jgi:hypothetical protein
MGVPKAATVADRISQSHQGGGSVSSIPHYVSVDFADAIQVVLYVMCGIMAAAGVIALFGLRRGRQETVPLDDEPVPAEAAPG